jgi:hypothetical protein
LINNFMVIFMGIKWWFSWIENDDFHGDFTKKWDIIMGFYTLVNTEKAIWIITVLNR